MMSECIAQRLNQFVKSTAHKSVKPFYLFNCSGKLLHTYINVKGCIVKSSFFAVESVDEKNQSAVLNILVPFPFSEDDYCCTINVLLRTDKYIIVDLNCFCGLVEIPIRVCDYVIVADLIKDTICLPYTMNKDDSPKVIWSTAESTVSNTATISIKGEEGATLNIYSKEGRISFKKSSQSKTNSITIPNINKIELEPSSMNTISGIIEIQLNRKLETKISLI